MQVVGALARACSVLVWVSSPTFHVTVRVSVALVATGPQLQGVADGGVAGDLGAVGKPGELRWAAGAGWHLLVGDIDSDVAEHALVVVGV